MKSAETAVGKVASGKRSQLQIEERFRKLASEWKAERGPSSSAVQMAMHPAYQQIIGLGEPAIPLLLHELKTDPDHWFWALWAITGENPVPPASRGNIREMVQAWLQWGEEHGYLADRL